MGYAVPAAMGAKVAEPDRVVWAIDGDGCFQMTNQELATCTINDIPIKVAIINNSSLGMVRQWQTLFYDGRHSFTDLNTGHTAPDAHPRLREARPRRTAASRIRVDEEGGGGRRDQAGHRDQRPPGRDRLRRERATRWCGRWCRRASATSYVQYARDHAPDVGGGVSHVDVTCCSLLVEDKPGLLTRVAGLFARRGFNIESLAVGETEIEGLSRITVVVDVEELPARAGHEAAEQAGQRHQDRRARSRAVRAARAHARSRCASTTRPGRQVLEAVDPVPRPRRRRGARCPRDRGHRRQRQGQALLRVLEPYGIKEIAQSGLLAIGRGGKSITERVFKN